MNVFVTGSEGGIGKAVVERFVAGEGAGSRANRVYRYDPWAGRDDTLMTTGDRTLELCERVVVCHGINDPVPPGTTPEVYPTNTDMWQANVFSIIDMAKRWVYLRKGLGEGVTSGRNAFVVVTSNSAEIARSRSIDYCAGKAAIDMALRVMQRNHVREGFEFHSVEAGHVDTPMFERMSGILGADVMKAGYMRSPLQRLIEPAELADYIHYLCTAPAAKWLSGRGVRFDGGEQ